MTWIVKTKEYNEPCQEDYKHCTWIVKSEEYDEKYYSEKKKWIVPLPNNHK